MTTKTNNRTTTQLVVAQGAAGSLDLVAAPGTDFRVYVVTICLVSDVAGTVKFTEGTGPTDLTGAMVTGVGSQLLLGGNNDFAVLQTITANAKLSLVSVTSKLSGFIRYYVDL
jgi:hypothetical protein